MATLAPTTFAAAARAHIRSTPTTAPLQVAHATVAFAQLARAVMCTFVDVLRTRSATTTTHAPPTHVKLLAQPLAIVCTRSTRVHAPTVCTATVSTLAAAAPALCMPEVRVHQTPTRVPSSAMKRRRFVALQTVNRVMTVCTATVLTDALTLLVCLRAIRALLVPLVLALVAKPTETASPHLEPLVHLTTCFATVPSDATVVVRVCRRAIHATLRACATATRRWISARYK